MDFLPAIAELLRIWIEGGTWAEIKAAQGFHVLLATACFAAPSSIIALGIGHTDWRETPLALVLGFRPREPDDWAARARDTDKDGLPDF
ncbi:MAG: hypothetical protein AB7P07_03965 [Hyphomonadaceae bacterium]